TMIRGAQTGKQFRMRGKGMPIMRSSDHGDMYIQVVIETPQKLTRKQRELLEEFEKISSEENSPQSTGFFSRMKKFLDGFAD
ncbi:MAG: DnaJ C-terminal domain-containing protein, partial [Pseudomonadota bacterium]